MVYLKLIIFCMFFNIILIQNTESHEANDSSSFIRVRSIILTIYENEQENLDLNNDEIKSFDSLYYFYISQSNIFMKHSEEKFTEKFKNDVEKNINILIDRITNWKIYLDLAELTNDSISKAKLLKLSKNIKIIEEKYKDSLNIIYKWIAYQNIKKFDEIKDGLEKYQLKYGANAPKLNIVETLLNLWLFKPDKEYNPNPYELIISYNTAYFKISQNKNEDEIFSISSAIDLGLRYYIFENHWYIPDYLSFGLNLSNQKTGVLNFPEFNKYDYLGLFVNIGDFKISYQHQFDNNNYRFLISKQIQFIPFLL